MWVTFAIYWLFLLVLLCLIVLMALAGIDLPGVVWFILGSLSMTAAIVIAAALKREE